MQSIPSNIEPGSKKKVVLFILAIAVLCGGIATYINSVFQKTAQVQSNTNDEIANYSTDISAIKPVDAKTTDVKKKRVLFPIEDVFQNN